MVLLEAELNEGLGYCADLLVVLSVRGEFPSPISLHCKGVGGGKPANKSGI